MKVSPIYFKYSVILVVAVLLFMLFRGCGKTKTVPTRPTIVTKIDTVYTQAKSDTHYVPKPYQVTKYVEYAHEVIIPEKVDTSAILKDYLTKRYYKDTVYKSDMGYVAVMDTINNNRIAGRGVYAELKQREITKTVTITGTMPERNVVLFGFGASANKNSWLGTNANIALQTKNRKIYSAGIVLGKDGNIYYSGQIYIPIRLKKKPS